MQTTPESRISLQKIIKIDEVGSFGVLRGPPNASDRRTDEQTFYQLFMRLRYIEIYVSFFFNSVIEKCFFFFYENKHNFCQSSIATLYKLQSGSNMATVIYIIRSDCDKNTDTSVNLATPCRQYLGKKVSLHKTFQSVLFIFLFCLIFSFVYLSRSSK